jgi:hypothetical protein
MIVPGYRQFGGVYGESAAVRNVLAHLELAAPHTGEPFSEAMLFGISGGIGFAYFTFKYIGHPAMLYIGVAHRYRNRYGEHMDGLYDRLGVQTTVRTTRSENVAEKHLREALRQGQPVILHVDSGELPFYSGSMDHALVAYGYDEPGDLVLVADRALVPVTITAEGLAVARAGLASLKHRSTTLRPPATIDDLDSAIRAGIRVCHTSMTNPPNPAGNFGLNGLQKWATLVNDAKNARGWPRLFGPDLYTALYWTFTWIEVAETGSGALRGMYADFLGEAGEVLDRPDLQGVAERYREAAKLWHDLSHTALPDAVPFFKETKDLAYRKERLFTEKGGAALPEMARIERRRAEIKAAVADAFPLDAGLVDDLLGELAAGILRLYDVEKSAIEALQAIVG